MEFANFSAELLSFLFIVSIVAGFLDTLAGGGGLIAMPALIMSGVPPLAALGTNKLQGSMGTGTATYMMLTRKKVLWRDIRYLMLTAFVGAIAGTVIVQFVETEVLSFLIPCVLLFIAVYFLLSPMPKESASKPLLSQGKFKNIVVPSIGCYDGMFGPGTGSFFALAGVSCKGQPLITSTANAKPLNFSTNIASLIIFISVGQVVWLVGILMMMGQVFGAWLGSHCLFKINPMYLRFIVVTMSLSMLAKYCHSMNWFNIL